MDYLSDTFIPDHLLLIHKKSGYRYHTVWPLSLIMIWWQNYQQTGIIPKLEISTISGKQLSRTNQTLTTNLIRDYWSNFVNGRNLMHWNHSITWCNATHQVSGNTFHHYMTGKITKFVTSTVSPTVYSSIQMNQSYWYASEVIRHW